jgi:hypothetical protein
VIRAIRRRGLAVAALLLPLIAITRVALAHEGEDHGDAPAPPASAAPRAEARSDLFEVVTVLGPDGRLWIYLDRFASTAPIDNASVQVNLDGRELTAERASEAVYVIADPAFAQPGTRDLVLTVTAGDDMDLLPVSLAVLASAVATAGSSGFRDRAMAALREPILWGLATGLLLIGFLIGRAAAPRPLPPEVEKDTPATIGIRLAAEAAPTKAATAPPAARRIRTSTMALALLLGAPFAAMAQPMDQPRRQPDGSVFVPKPTQRLLGVRTVLVDRTEAPVSVQLVGQVIPDPNASGRVQASEAGRIEPPEGGFPALGQRVARGDVLGFVVPIMAAQDRVGVRANIAELDALIVIGEARVRRLTALTGTVAAREISDARADLEGLRQRRAANLPAVTGREPIVAPSAGRISVVRVAAGQVIQAQEPLFDIVDPGRLWVEAVAFDAAAVAEIIGGDAVTSGGQRLPLAFVGRGLSLRQQAVPLQFRITEAPAGLSVGTPVTVTVQTPRRAGGIVLPAAAVVRSADGPQVVFEMPGAERFVPRPVRVQPLDGRQVLVTAGLERGARVVTEAASLIAQVR